MDRSSRMMGGKGKVSEDDGTFDREFWKSATPEERVTAIFELRELYHEVMHPGTGAKRLDRMLVASADSGNDCRPSKSSPTSMHR